MKKKCSCESLFQKVAVPFGYEVDGVAQAGKDQPAPDYCAVELTKGERSITLRNARCADGSHENLRALAHAIGLAFGAPAKVKKAVEVAA